MTEDELDDLVEAWHNGAGEGQELHEFLGMTWDEYGMWVTGMPPKPWPCVQTSQRIRQEAT